MTDKQHHADSQTLRNFVRHVQCALLKTKIRRVLIEESKLRTDQQNQPGEIEPEHPEDHDRESGVDDFGPVGAGDELCEQLAAADPDDPCEHAAQ